MSYSLYESLKQEWIRKNPEATPAQYQKAMRAISRKAGV
jgi:hypothetical protein